MAGLESLPVPVVDAVEVLLAPDGTPYINSSEHREHGIKRLAYLAGDVLERANEVVCHCGATFRIAAVRPEPLSFVAVPEADWDDEAEADTVPNGIPPTRIGFRARRPAC